MDNTEINDGYESYDDDFDSGIDSADDVGSYNNAEAATADTTDLVARLISGEDISEEETESVKSRNSGRVMTSRSVDGDGRPDWGTDSRSQGDDGGSDKPDVNNTIYHQQVQQQGAYAASEWQSAHQEAQRLQDMFESGQLSAEDHHRLSYEQGQRAAAAKEGMYMARIQELEHGQQRQAQMKLLETELGADFAPDKVTTTMHDMVDFARKNGISDDVLQGVETVQEAKFIYDAMKNQSELERAQIELKAARQMLKKQNQALKGRRLKQHKDANVGQKNRDTIDEVAELLAELGHGRTR